MILSLILTLLINPSFGAIYGHDDRMNIIDVPVYSNLASGIAISVPNNFLSQQSDSSWKVLDVEKLGMSSQVYACMSERFALEPIIGNCTGFLIDQRHLLTAGHCALPNGVIDNAKHPFCENFTWIFDFNVKKDGTTPENNLSDTNVYGCKKIVRAENIEFNSGNFGNDFAIIELDRDVDERILRNKLSLQSPSTGSRAFTIGHPSGLPAKFSGISQILKTNNEYYFEINLDTQAGNSGSPVFNMNKEVIGILVSGHGIDYYRDPSGCYKTNVCNLSGKSCNEDSPFAHTQVSNYIQRLDKILPYLK